MRVKLSVDMSAISHCGKVRNNNEDMVYAGGHYFDNSELSHYYKDESQKGRLLIYAVCDGMGGENAGEKASYEAVRLLDEYFKAIGSIKIKNINQLIERFRIYIKQTNEKIYSLWADSGEGRMGSTFAGLAFCGNKATALNIGDSRVYMLRGDILTQLTKDHTEAERLASIGLIKRDEIRAHKGHHMLTRHFGTTPEEGIMEADFSKIVKLKKGDVFMICSDGLTDMVGDDRIRQLMKRKGKSSEISRLLVDEALNNGGKDNVSVIVVKVGTTINRIRRLIRFNKSKTNKISYEKNAQ